MKFAGTFAKGCYRNAKDITTPIDWEKTKETFKNMKSFYDLQKYIKQIKNNVVSIYWLLTLEEKIKEIRKNSLNKKDFDKLLNTKVNFVFEVGYLHKNSNVVVGKTKIKFCRKTFRHYQK